VQQERQRLSLSEQMKQLSSEHSKSDEIVINYQTHSKHLEQELIDARAQLAR